MLCLGSPSPNSPTSPLFWVPKPVGTTISGFLTSGSGFPASSVAHADLHQAFAVLAPRDMPTPGWPSIIVGWRHKPGANHNQNKLGSLLLFLWRLHGYFFRGIWIQDSVWLAGAASLETYLCTNPHPHHRHFLFTDNFRLFLLLSHHTPTLYLNSTVSVSMERKSHFPPIHTPRKQPTSLVFNQIGSNWW